MTFLFHGGDAYIKVEDVVSVLEAVTDEAGRTINADPITDPQTRLARAVDRVQTLTRLLVGEREQRMRERHAWRDSPQHTESKR